MCCNPPLGFSVKKIELFQGNLESKMEIKITNLIWSGKISLQIKFPKGQPSLIFRSFCKSVTHNMLGKSAEDTEHRDKYKWSLSLKAS